MNTKKRFFILLGFIIAGPLAGYLLTTLWFMGGGSFWKPIDYFPQPVTEIIALQPYGNEFWVTAADGLTYRILYPCAENDTCWETAETVPAIAPSDKLTTGSGQCENDYFLYPLSETIRTCVTSTTLAKNPLADATKTAGTPWVVSLAVTDTNTLWIWQKPWDFTSTINIFKFFFAAIGLAIGLLADTLFAGKIE